MRSTCAQSARDAVGAGRADNGISLDVADEQGPAHPQHYALLVTESGPGVY